MFNGDVISMPDKWEYPWYAAWDLAFHTLAVAGRLRLRQGAAPADAAQPLPHPNGQIPAYEWNFSDVNPPVHAWATLFLYKVERGLGREDIKFLERSFRGFAQFQLVGQPQGPAGRNVFAADSWASTTSASSTAARRFRPAARSNRRTGRPGWPSTARTCSRSR